MAEAREVLDLLDAGAVAALTPLLAPRLQGWDADPWIRDWVAGLDSLLGSPRSVASETHLSSTLTRFHLEHAITDFRTWLAAFGRFADARRNAGVRDERVHQPIRGPHYVIIDLDFDTVDEANAFLHLLETVVWSNPANAPALAGSPRALVLERAAAASLTLAPVVTVLRDISAVRATAVVPPRPSMRAAAPATNRCWRSSSNGITTEKTGPTRLSGESGFGCEVHWGEWAR